MAPCLHDLQGWAPNPPAGLHAEHSWLQSHRYAFGALLSPQACEADLSMRVARETPLLLPCRPAPGGSSSQLARRVAPHASCSTITAAAALQVSIRAPLFTISTQGLAAPNQQPLELKLSHHNLVVSGDRQGSAGGSAALEGPLYRLTVATTGAAIRLGLPDSQPGCAFDCGGAALEAEVSRGMLSSSPSETVPVPPEACKEVSAVTNSTLRALKTSCIASWLVRRLA